MSARCSNVFCGEREADSTPSRWWRDYGTCSYACAIDYYGEECVE